MQRAGLRTTGNLKHKDSPMNYPDFINATRDQSRTLFKTIPDTMKGFGALSKAAKDSPAIGVKEKEFVALGIAVAVRCEPCIAFQCRGADESGGHTRRTGRCAGYVHPDGRWTGRYVCRQGFGLLGPVVRRLI